MTRKKGWSTYIVVAVLCLCVLAVAAWADNSRRIAELRERQKAIIIEIGQREDIVNTQQGAISSPREEFLKAQGAIDELTRQDEPAKRESKGKTEKK